MARFQSTHPILNLKTSGGDMGRKKESEFRHMMGKKEESKRPAIDVAVSDAFSTRGKRRGNLSGSAMRGRPEEPSRSKDGLLVFISKLTT